MDKLVRFTSQQLVDAYNSGNLKGSNRMKEWMPNATDDKHRQFILQLMLMKALGQLKPENVEKEFLKIYAGYETLDTTSILPLSCQQALTNLMAASDRNVAVRDSYNDKLKLWQSQLDALNSQQPTIKQQRNEYPKDVYTRCYNNTSDRDNEFRHDCANLNNGSPLYKWDGQWDSYCPGVPAWWARGRCNVDMDAETAKWQANVNNLQNQKPASPVYENLPTFNCLACSQTISVTDGSVVNADKLQQQMNCYISEKGAATKTPSTETTSSKSVSSSSLSDILQTLGLGNNEKTYAMVLVIFLLCLLCVLGSYFLLS